MLTAQEAVDLLNSALHADPTAITALCDVRVPCNQELANHPTIVTFKGAIGILGLLTGFFWNSSDGELLAAEYADETDDQSLLRFITIDRKDVETPQEPAPSQG